MTEEECREMARNNYAAQMEMLGYQTDGSPKDMVEVVRCKDCTYLNADTGICIVGIPHGYKDTFYCAYGKRR